MLVYLLYENKKQLNIIELSKEDVLGLKINDELAINHKNYSIIKRNFIMKKIIQ